MITNRLIADAAGRFFWLPETGKPTGAVELNIPGMLVPVAGEAMAPLLASVTITDVADDLRTLTLSAPAAASIGGTGRKGVVFVDLGIAGRYRARIEAFVGASSVRLVNALPLAESVTPDSGGASMTLSWLVYYVDLPALTIGTATARNLRWSVSWTLDGGSVADEPRQSRGLVDVVQQVPTTGLTHFGLCESAPSIASLVPPGQESYEPQIRRALGTLEGWVRRRLEAGRFIDQVDFSQWIEAHRHLTLLLLAEDSSIAGFGGQEKATYHREEARSIFEDYPALRWIDTDDDGAVTSGETEVQNAPLRAFGGGLEPDAVAGQPDLWDLSRDPWADI